MTTFAVVNDRDLLPAVNYLLSNLDTGNVSGNVVLPGNVVVANTTTGAISQVGNNQPFAYLYQFVNLRYSNNATGTAGFDTNSNNYSYFGVYNSSGPTPSANPAAYQWFEVTPPFNAATSRTLYYSAIGGRQVQWAAASSPPTSGFQVTQANVAIDLDVVTTATGTPGERGPIAASFVITTATPIGASSAQLTTWFSASRDAVSPPIGTGLQPVAGDTATFTWAAGPGKPTATYSYNGSIWVPATGQVISGNVIIQDTLAGNAIIAGSITSVQIAGNTITSNNIATGTITATNIAANTITGTNIAANTIVANNIATGTITSAKIATGTITATNIAANTITSNNIATGTITATNIAANTITGTNIAGNTITGNKIAANTVSATNIVTGTITANLIAGNTITANNIATGSLTTNLFTAGTINANILTANTFQANTINGQAIVASSITADKLAANVLTANTVISTGAQLGNFNSLGFWLDGSTGNARFGNTLSVGGNLNVTGLITASNLNANSVITTTMQPEAVTTSDALSVGDVVVQTNPVNGRLYFYPGPTVITTVPNQRVTIFWQGGVEAIFTGTAASPASIQGNLRFSLTRYRVTGTGITGVVKLFEVTKLVNLAGITNTPRSSFIFNETQPTVLDVVPAAGTYVYSFGLQWDLIQFTGPYPTISLTLTTREATQEPFGLNTIVTLATKR